MADIDRFQTSIVRTEDIGQAIDETVTAYKSTRYSFERRWYDNKFFDDGYHFRFLQRTTNKIVDLAERASMYNPTRAIPKASRQVRGVANLLMSNDPTPVVYPERINTHAFAEDPEGLKQAQDQAKWKAKLVGHWISEEFKKQEINEKLAHLLILAMVQGVAYLQIWPDAVEEKIRTQVYDAFDIYLDGKYTDIQDCPVLIKGIPKLISEIKANELFDETQRMKINADNKLASSDIKEAYLRSRFGSERATEATATVLLKEAFIKEYVNKNNSAKIKNQKDASDVLLRKKEGDMVIRHAFVAGNIWLFDEYLDIDKYPFVDFRMEPGPIYQVPLIERFIPLNKSLDMLVSRIERYSHTMVTGSWSVKAGEPDKPNNSAGGQIFKYNTTPPVQNIVAPLPAFVFNFIQILNTYVEEQGVSTSALNKIPAGVKAARAIESLKESEYANLSIAQRRFKNTVKRISERFMDIADNYFTQPQEAQYMEKGEPVYFDIVGKRAYDEREKLGVPVTGDVVPISKDYHVDVDVEQGMGYTRQGRQETALELANFFGPLVQAGVIPPEAFQKFVEKLLETFEFGPANEMIEAMKAEGGGLQQANIEQLKVAMAEVLKDLAGSEILPDTKMRVDETKVGVAEVMKDTGLLDNRQEPQEENKPPSRSISFKDLPPSGKQQLAAQAGIDIGEEDIEMEDMRNDQREMQKSKEMSKMKGGQNPVRK